MQQFLSYKYQPLINLFETDSIDLKNQKDYIPFGDDNLLPQQIVQLSRSVAVHRAIINSKAFFTRVEAGRIAGIIFKDTLTAAVDNEVEGIRSGTKFTVRLKGNPDSAARAIRKTLEAQRVGSGEYRRYLYHTPASGPDGNPIKAELYINGGKNSKMVKTEIDI